MKRYLRCGCDAQTRYECGGLGQDTCPYATYGMSVSLAVCEGIHEIPEAEGAIFPQNIDNPMDFAGMFGHAFRALREYKSNGVTMINLYVTGLTPAVLATVNAAQKLAMSFKLWHYNRESGDYKLQPWIY